MPRPFSKGLHVVDYLILRIFAFVGITINLCPLGKGGRPKARGWICLEEAESAKQR